MKNFKLNGYQKVSPPLIEYEKNFKYFLDTTKDENIFRLVETDDIFIGIKKIENKYVLNEKNQNQIIKIYRPDVKKNSINSWQGRLCWDIPFICSYNNLIWIKNKIKIFMT